MTVIPLSPKYQITGGIMTLPERQRDRQPKFALAARLQTGPETGSERGFSGARNSRSPASS